MSSMQRRRGDIAYIVKTAYTKDARGNIYQRPLGERIQVRAAFIPDRSSRAEVPGQMDINVYTMILKSDIPDVNIWSRVEWNNAWWDIVTPPELHHGVRSTRHWTMSIRRRPDGRGSTDA